MFKIGFTSDEGACSNHHCNIICAYLLQKTKNDRINKICNIGYIQITGQFQHFKNKLGSSLMREPAIIITIHS